VAGLGVGGYLVSSSAQPWITKGAMLVLPSVIWLLIFAVLPAILLIVLSLWTTTVFGIDRTLTLANYHTIAAEGAYLAILAKTLRIAVMATILSLLASYPLAMFLVRLRGLTKSVFLLLMFLPFWTSYVVRSFAWLPMLGRHGLINHALLSIGIIHQPINWLLFTEGTVYVGLVYVFTIYMTLPIYLALDRLDFSLIEVASDLGGRPHQIFWRVVLPISLPGVFSGCTMVFLISAGAFVTPQLLGGSSGIMIGNIIAQQFLSTSNWPLGAALSVLLMVTVLIVFGLAGRRIGLSQLALGGRQ
jgi:spermidine/putrescine transport system permease protein